MKDHFSTIARQYAAYRPGYPKALFEYLQLLCGSATCVWDCATGNGQAAVQLASFCKQVYATDISQAQLSQATPLTNIQYLVMPAEQTSFPNHFFDFVLVAQAVHWFNFDAFYKEVKRTVKPGGFCIVMGYGRCIAPAPINVIINLLYSQVLKNYWDKERRYIDKNYETIPFPFQEIAPPAITNKIQWNLKQLLGYLYTWSAVKNYLQQNGSDPIAQIADELATAWGDENATISIEFPLLLRIGKIN